MRLEPDGVVEACLVVDAGDLERADTDAIRGDADAHVPRGQLLVGEEGAQRADERFRVANLAVERRCRARAGASELEQLVTTIRLLDDRGSKL